MSTYFTRIELHNATWPDDYNKLHTAMRKRGFTNKIGGDDGLTYFLPTAEYFCNSMQTTHQVRALAEEAANTIGLKYAVLTILFTFASFEGLQPV